MALVKLGFYQLSVPERIQLSKNIVIKMTGNAKFTTPVPTLTSITAAITALETAYEAASDGGKSKTALVNIQNEALNVLMAQLAVYVQQASAGDGITIFSSGMEVRAIKTPSQPLTAPLALKALMGALEGTVALKWQHVTGAKSYLIQQSADGNATWTIVSSSTKSNAIVTGFIPNGKMWFRVAAVGPKGQGPWCDAVKGVAG
ncbi:MAG: fibronectin type III domain-containing protein [Ferruginibacter sp.]